MPDPRSPKTATRMNQNGMDLPFLEAASFWSNISVVALTVLAAIAGAFALYFSSRLSALKDADMTRFQLESTKRIEEAKLEQEKLKRENLELEKLLLPRGIRLGLGTLEQLKQFAETPIVIWAAPDFEATRFADRLGELLQMADWQVTRDDISPRSLFGAALPDNVTIITRSDIPPPESETDMKRGLSAAEMVLTFMKFSEVEAIKIQNTDIPNLAWNEGCVIVGVKSTSAIVMRRFQEKWKDRSYKAE